MKRTLKSLAAIALIALTAAACQKESFSDSQTAGEETVTFTVQTEVGTKAVADDDGLAAKIDQVLVAVYMKDGDNFRLYDTPSAEYTSATKTATFSVNLIRKQTYQVVVWAQKNGAYDCDEGLQSIVRASAKASACNDDELDAFYASHEYVQGSPTATTNIVAKRPFAQLNLITKDLRTNFEPSEVTITYVSDTKFNALTGLSSEPAATAVTYTAAQPNYKAQGKTLNATQNTLAMNYLFAPATEQIILPSVKMTAKLTEVVDFEVTNVPAKRNYRTNVIGNLLTEKTDFTISVNPIWGNPDIEVNVADNITAANAAFAAGNTVVEVAEITSSDPDVIILPDTDQPVSLTLPAAPADKTITIQYPDSPTQTPATLEVNANSLTNLVVDAPSTHVELNGITATNVTASTSETTLVVGADANIDNLTLNKGALEIYGRVKNLIKAEGAGEVKCWTVYSPQQLTNAAAATKKVVLGKNISALSTITLDGVDTEIDLNGYKISKYYLPLKIQNSKVKFTGTGSISANTQSTMQIAGSGTDVADYTVVTIGKDVTVSNGNGSTWGILIDKDVAGTYNNYGIVLNVEGTISTRDNGGAGAITINGSNKNTAGNVPVINFNGANIKFGSIGVYGAGYAKWNFTNTNIEGKLSAMEIRAGEVTINGGNYVATNDTFSAAPNGGGTTMSGVAIAVSQHATNLHTSVTVNDGNFKGVYALYEKDLQDELDRDKIKVQVNGGTFDGKVYSQNCPLPTYMGYMGEELPAAPAINGDVMTVNVENAQYALDGAYGSIDGKTINFSAGTYPQLIFGRPNKYPGSHTLYRHGNFDNAPMSYEDFVAYKNQSGWTEGCKYERIISNVTFTAESGAVLTGMSYNAGDHIYGSAESPVYDYVLDKGTTTVGSCYFHKLVASNIVYEGITFQKVEGYNPLEIASSSAISVIDGVTVSHCNFIGTGTASTVGQAIRFYTENQSGAAGTEGKVVRNLVVKNTDIDNFFQGIYTNGAYGVTVEGCTISNTGHNAIALQTNTKPEVPAVNLGQVKILSNTFDKIGDRIIRLGNVAAGSSFTIISNTATNSGDAHGEVLKAGTLAAEGITYVVHDNSWGEDKTVVNPEFRDQPAN